MEIEEAGPLPNYLRTHRKKTGLSQQELAILMGYDGTDQISRHEQFSSLPPIAAAVAYEVIYRVPIAELFPGLSNRVEQDVERRIAVLKKSLGQRSGRDRCAATTARKLEWIAMRSESA